MSRIVMVLGILLIVVGAAGTVFGMIGVPMQFVNNITQAVSPKAEDLCKAGEKLVEEGGASSYTPGVGYGRNVQYYCVNDAGERRSVTGNFVEGMFSDVLGSVGSLAIPILSGGLITIGVILTVLGALFSRRGRYQVMTSQYTFAGANVPPTFTTTTRSPSPTRAPVQGDLAAKLRQIEDAHTSGLINDDEYQRMRQEVLESMK